MKANRAKCGRAANGAAKAAAEPGAGVAMDIKVAPNPDEPDDAAIARTVLRPNVRAAETWARFSPSLTRSVNLTAMVDELSKQSTAVIGGSMDRPEAMLIAQAHALDAIFHELARRAALNMGTYLDAADTYLRLALKAQSQSRATLETLSAVKNPPAPVAFVKQANIANGPQQVNNCESLPRARETLIRSNELLENQGGERLDRGAARFAGAEDSTMETVAQVDGPENRARQATRKRKRD
jgi:hypothetical protein